jgi:hypothetical protein
MPVPLAMLPAPLPQPPVALTKRQTDVLILVCSARGPMPRRTIAERLDKASVRAEVLRLLIDRALLEEVPVADDGRRERCLWPTPAGRALAKAITSGPGSRRRDDGSEGAR